MRNDQLDELLKTVKVPTESPDFCGNLPRDVFCELKRGPQRPQNGVSKVRETPSHPRLALATWCTAVALILLLGFWSQRPRNKVGITDQQLSEARKYYNELAALFPSQLRAVVLGRTPPTLSLAEKPDVPQGEPVLVQMASPNSRASVVVLNGQEFSFEGKRYEVLLDYQGDVLVVGPDCAWSSREAGAGPGRLQIAARSLDAAS